MQIKTADGTANVGSSGVANAGLTTGIIGTVGALLGGGLSGLFGGGGNIGTSKQDSHIRELLGLSSELAREKSERYADSIGLEAYKIAVDKAGEGDRNLNDKFTFLLQKVYELDKDAAVNKQAVTDNFAFLNNKIDTTRNELYCYVNGNFVPGKLVMPLTSVCPEPMKQYNSWTAPTGTTTETAT